MHEVDIKEQEILKELMSVTGKRNLQVKDIMEWAEFEPEHQDGVQVIFLPVLKIYVCVEEK